MPHELKQLSIGGILDHSIRLMKEHFLLLFGAFAVISLPFNLLTNIGDALTAPAELPDDYTPHMVRAYNQAAQLNSRLNLLSSLADSLLIAPLANAAVIWAAAHRYLDRPVSLKESVQTSFRLVKPLLVTTLLFNLALCAGLIMLVVPLFLFAVWYSLCHQVTVLEGISGIDALTRSKQLIKGSGLQCVLLLLMLVIIGVSLVFGFEMIETPYVGLVLGTLVDAVFATFVTTVFVVFYFSCRCKHENFDLTVLADDVAANAHGAADSVPNVAGSV